jgi:hypothetical protein
MEEDAILNNGYHHTEMPWQLESIRATVIASDIKAVGLLNWKALTGIPAPQTQQNREVDGTVEAGPYTGHLLTMGVARRPGLGPGRADLILAPLSRTVTVPLDPLRAREEPAAIGPFITHLEGFVVLANRWLQTVTNIRRLALACTLFERTESPEDALDIILRNVPSFNKVGDDPIIDLAIQLNRPRRSQVNSSIFINRFAQWSARTVEIVLRPGLPPLTIRSERAQADLDISTPDRADITGSQVPYYLEEFAKLLVEIAEKGDTP